MSNYQKKLQKDRSNLKCFKCKRSGHFASECSQKEANNNSGPNRQNNSGSSRRKNSKNAAFSVNVKSEDREQWIFDSGATTHMSRRQDSLIDARVTSQVVNVANNAEVSVNAVGNMKLGAAVQGTPCEITLSDILCVPDLAVNLLSVSQICKKGHKVVFMSEACKVYNVQTNELVAMGYQSNGLYKLEMVDEPKACAVKSSGEFNIWHRRLGHMNFDNMKRLRSMVTGLDFKNERTSTTPCVPCIEGKHQRFPFKSKGSRATKVLDLVHSDLCGPMENVSIGGSKYFLTFIDDASRKTFVYFLRSKKEVLKAFQDFKAFVETQTGQKLKRLRTDNGGEYVGENFEQFIRANGICHETTVPYNPEQNGLAERMNRTIVERARALLFDAGLTKQFWAEAVGTAVYLINRSPTKGATVTPEEKFSGVRPDVSHLRIFGAKAMAYVPKNKRQKWDPKSEACLFMGYATNSKGYRLYDPRTGKVFVSRDVIIISETPGGSSDENVEIEVKQMELLTESEVESRLIVTPVERDVESDDESEDGYQTVDEFEEDPVSRTALPPQSSESLTEKVARHSARERRPPGKYSDYVVTYSAFPQKLAISQNVSSQRSTREGDGHPSTALPSQQEESVGEQHDSRLSGWERPVRGKYQNVSECNTVLPQMSSSQSMSEPTTYEEALNDENQEHWIEAMDVEYNALMQNRTWVMTDLPSGRKALRNKWVYKVKVKSDGSIERFKARLVIKGCSQIEGVDYTETYSPVVRYSTIRYLLAKAAELDLQIHQMDAVTAFLQGDLGDEEIYMQQPKGFEDERTRSAD